VKAGGNFGAHSKALGAEDAFIVGGAAGPARGLV